MRTSVIWILLGLAFTSTAFAENSPAQLEASSASFDSELSHPNGLSLELLGRGGFYSVDYDRMISNSVALGVGFSYLSLNVYDFSSDNLFVSGFILPLYANFYFSPEPNHIFLTAGMDVILAYGRFSDSKVTNEGTGGGVIGTLGAGYEYRGRGGFLLRLTPYLVLAASRVYPSAGVSFGGTF